MARTKRRSRKERRSLGARRRSRRAQRGRKVVGGGLQRGGFSLNFSALGGLVTAASGLASLAPNFAGILGQYGVPTQESGTIISAAGQAGP